MQQPNLAGPQGLTLWDKAFWYTLLEAPMRYVQSTQKGRLKTKSHPFSQGTNDKLKYDVTKVQLGGTHLWGLLT